MNNLIKILLFLLCLPVITEMRMFGSETDDAVALKLPGDTSDIFINGWEYKMIQAVDGHPFVFSKIWNFDTIFSSLGIRTNYLMNYDIYQDALVIQLFIKNQPYQITLNSSYIESFSVNSHFFINPSKHEPYLKGNFTGYYELIYEGDIKLLIKRQKLLNEDGNVKGSSYELRLKKLLYYRDEIYELRNKRTLYRMFPEHKREIAYYIRQNQIIVRTMETEALRKLIRYIDILHED